MLYTKEWFSKTFVDDNYVIQELIFLIVVLYVEVIKLLSFIVKTQLNFVPEICTRVVGMRPLPFAKTGE